MKAITFLIISAGLFLIGCKKNETVNDMYPDDEVIIQDSVVTGTSEFIPDTLDTVAPINSTDYDIDSITNRNP